jgi:protein-S-isoprenylcysteine O-methyltransferase Ste14
MDFHKQLFTRDGYATMLAFLSIFFGWTFIHSLTASNKFKILIRGVVGDRFFEGWYRLTYNVFSFLSFMPILALGSFQLSSDVIWKIPAPANYLFYAIQFIGLVGLAISGWQTDFLRFAGLRQAYRFLVGEAGIYQPPKMITSGAYAYVRHPLYLFSLMVIWFFPTMTYQLFVFNLGTTAYFLIGSYFEEKRLLRDFGDVYSSYQAAVPRLLPIKFK